MNVFLCLQWVCVPFVLMNTHTRDITQTLMNNTLHAPWIGHPDLTRIWVMMDDFLVLVSHHQDCLSWIYWEKIDIQQSAIVVILPFSPKRSPHFYTCRQLCQTRPLGDVCFPGTGRSVVPVLPPEDLGCLLLSQSKDHLLRCCRCSTTCLWTSSDTAGSGCILHR